MWLIGLVSSPNGCRLTFRGHVVFVGQVDYLFFAKSVEILGNMSRRRDLSGRGVGILGSGFHRF